MNLPQITPLIEKNRREFLEGCGVKNNDPIQTNAPPDWSKIKAPQVEQISIKEIEQSHGSINLGDISVFNINVNEDLISSCALKIRLGKTQLKKMPTNLSLAEFQDMLIEMCERFYTTCTDSNGSRLYTPTEIENYMAKIQATKSYLLCSYWDRTKNVVKSAANSLIRFNEYPTVHFKYKQSAGFALIKKCQVFYGGVLINEMTGKGLYELYKSQLTPENFQQVMENAGNQAPTLKSDISSTTYLNTNRFLSYASEHDEYTLIIPLNLPCNLNKKMSLPTNGHQPQCTIVVHKNSLINVLQFQHTMTQRMPEITLEATVYQFETFIDVPLYNNDAVVEFDGVKECKLVVETVNYINKHKSPVQLNEFGAYLTNEYSCVVNSPLIALPVDNLTGVLTELVAYTQNTEPGTHATKKN